MYQCTTLPILSIIAEGNLKEMLKYLESNLSYLRKDIYGYPLIHHAVKSGHKNIVQVLLAEYASRGLHIDY